MINSVNSTNKISATSYLNNLFYYNQSTKPSAGLTRFLQNNSRPNVPFLKDAATGIAAFLKSAGDVKSSARQLTKPDTSAFFKRTANTSDKTKVTATTSHTASLQEYEVKVDQVAASQTNSGTLLSQTAPSAVGIGTNEMKITIGGKSTTVTAFIHSGDTNEQALNRLKDSINKAQSGVAASVITDSSTGKKKLELKSSQTGTKQAFTVSDVTGSAAAATGITNVTGAAADAVYSVGGGTNQTSQSNTIELEKGKVTATLLKPTTDDVHIHVTSDEDETLKQVKQLVNDYNTLHKRMSEAGNHLNPSVKRSVETAATGYDFAGIVKKADGSLQLDEDKFKESLKSRHDQTRTMISGSYGFADRLAKAAERLETVPSASLMNTKGKNLQQFAAYQASMSSYFQFQSNGWLFDGTF